MRSVSRPGATYSYAAAADAYAEQRFRFYRRVYERQRRKKKVDASYVTITSVFYKRVV